MTENELIENCKGLLTLTADKDLQHNNANKPSEMFHTQRDLLAGEINKYLVAQELPKHLLDAHNLGKIHIHDMDYRAQGYTNCCLVDLGGMLKNGTKIGNANIETPKSITTACAITAQIIAQVSGAQYGGTSIDRIDEVLAPYVRKSYNKHLGRGLRWLKDERKAAVYATELTEKECYDAFQALEYETNSLFNSNGQTPFITLGFGLGQEWEERMIQKAILQNRIKGLGAAESTPIFPKLVFSVKEGLNKNPGDPNYDIKQLALECSATRMYPDYLSYEKVVAVTGDFKAPMGCRSFLSAIPSGEIAGRNNLGVVSINLPMVAAEADGVFEDFWDILDKYVDEAFEAHDFFLNRLKKVKAKQAPILYMHGGFGVRLEGEEYVWPIFEGRSSVSLGYIGVYEMCQIMFSLPQTHRDCIEFTEEVLTHLKNRCEVKATETNLGFSLYATPSESLCNRFNKLLERRFPEYSWLADKGYLTNSHHLDVREKVAPDTKFEYEAHFTKIANGGNISFVELPQMKKFHKALEYVVDKGLECSHYIGVNIPIDECFNCGYMGESIASERGFVCPSCGSEEIEVTRRVCGYLGSPGSRPFNSGKQKEVLGRVKHLNFK
ncbi:putative anaerobic ribonulceoside-triphosphate reductase [Escherichia phage JLBYU43]|uniref:Ribonucleotide reductase of class III (Anaerobic), large subunit n=2 Tax=Markadamsvirinae TaxID=2732013 RepID=A0A5J6D6X5_9CAUD|nr:NrdD-like anaerobic ribonucleotide reductase large subunit [Salmonella phage 2-3]QEQ93413.1 ribonucleotide reductase of class III (anaerobic), large subunit [Salmonella phage 2-3]UGO55695.1 putative anaerobic ribonulceoside-triphosphate reductase [Escherichia phage JLBYU43]